MCLFTFPKYKFVLRAVFPTVGLRSEFCLNISISKKVSKHHHCDQLKHALCPFLYLSEVTRVEEFIKIELTFTCYV